MWHWILDLFLIFLLIMLMVDVTFLWVRRIYNFLYHFRKWVILFDLDGFKVVNDQQGHPVGDKVLREVGLILLRGSRFRAFRYGGDEFAILVFGSDKDKVIRLAEKIAKRINQKLEPFGVTVSFGIGQTEQEADAEMYQMKEENKR